MTKTQLKLKKKRGELFCSCGYRNVSGYIIKAASRDSKPSELGTASQISLSVLVSFSDGPFPQGGRMAAIPLCQP